MNFTKEQLSDMISGITQTVINTMDTDQTDHNNDITINDEDLANFHLNQNIFEDASASYFFLRELEHVQRISRDTKQKALKGMMLVPLSSEAPGWASTITWRRMTKVGRAKLVDDYAHDFPRADAYREEFSIKVKDIGGSYGYNKKEIQAASAMGMPLARDKAAGCRRANEEELNDIILNGNSAHNISGFLDYPGISEYSTPDGIGGDSEFETKTPDEILADLNGIVDTIQNTTNAVEDPDTLLLARSSFRHISTTRLSDSDSETILSFFLKTNGSIKNVDWLIELETAGAGSSKRMIAYKKDPNYLRVEIPQMYTEEPPQQKGMEFEIVAHSSTAGVLVYFPLSMAYADNI